MKTNANMNYENHVKGINEKIQKYISETGKVITPNHDEIVFAVEKMKSFLKNYIKQWQLKSMILGVSGGLDSSFVAYIARQVSDELSAEGYRCPLIGVSIPLNSSSNHKADAELIGKVCDSFMVVDAFEKTGMWYEKTVLSMIEDVLDSTDKVCIDAGFNNFDKALQKGNMYARMRMITQYAIANKCGGIVLSTENQSEAAQVYNQEDVDNDRNNDLAVGQAFFTKYGDAGVDISFIGGCDKGFTIPAIARYLGIPEHIIEKAPSDDLGVTEENTDAAQLHFDYKGVDAIMYGYRKILPKYLQDMFEEIKENELVQAVIARHEKYSFKATPIVNLSRREIGLKMKYN